MEPTQKRVALSPSAVDVLRAELTEVNRAIEANSALRLRQAELQQSIALLEGASVGIFEQPDGTYRMQVARGLAPLPEAPKSDETPETAADEPGPAADATPAPRPGRRRKPIRQAQQPLSN